MKKLLLTAILLLIPAVGCDEGEESAASRVGSKVGETVTDFAQGVGKGIDKEMTVEVELSESLTKRGVSKTIAKSLGMEHPNQKGISVYLKSTEQFKAKLIAKAFDQNGSEIGRSIVDVELGADDAKHVTFTFEQQLDTQLVKKYSIDIRE